MHETNKTNRVQRALLAVAREHSMAPNAHAWAELAAALGEAELAADEGDHDENAALARAAADIIGRSPAELADEEFGRLLADTVQRVVATLAAPVVAALSTPLHFGLALVALRMGYMVRRVTSGGEVRRLRRIKWDPADPSAEVFGYEVPGAVPWSEWKLAPSSDIVDDVQASDWTIDNGVP